MTELDTSMAPGCYGAGLLYKPATSECRTCPFANTCGPIAEEQLARLQIELGIAPKKRKKAAPALPAAAPALTTSLPKKVQEHLDRFDRMGIKVTESLAKRQNPFGSSPFFMKVTCHLLIKCAAIGRLLSRDDLTMAFQDKLNHTKGTADAHVIQAIQILRALGAIEDVNGSIRLKVQA